MTTPALTVVPDNEHGEERPTLHPDALYGPIGRYVVDAAPHTEADPVAILAHLLVGVGVLANNGPHLLAGGGRHPGSLFATVVADSSKGRKGTAFNGARSVLAKIDHDFTTDRILGGFGSGEAFIQALSDQNAEGEDGGPRDTRTLIRASEFASVLKVAGRDGSTLGQGIRDAFDGSTLAVRTRGHGTQIVREGTYHVGASCDITMAELHKTLSDTDTYGGTVNRFLWVYAARSQLLPEGGNIPEAIVEQAADTLGTNLATARRHGLYTRTPGCADRWHDLYHVMASDDPPGLLGAAIARAEAQVLRLSLVYAIADGAPHVDTHHLNAAWAFWRYCRATTALIFPPSTTLAETLLAAIIGAGPDGLRTTALHALLGRNTTAAVIGHALDELSAAGQVVAETVRQPGQKGRPPTVVRYVGGQS